MSAPIVPLQTLNIMKITLTKVSAACLLISAAALAPFAGQAATQNVILDPNLTWNGFENVYTNGLVNTTPPPYRADYVGAGPSLPLQASIDSSGTVTIAPDIRMDQQYPFDPLVWADTSGNSAGICKVISTYYAENTSFASGDTVIFTGSLETNGLAAPYKDNAIVFIKDFDSGWGFRGITSVNLNTLTNGQSFSVSSVVGGAGDHVQWGVEWGGPPARQTTVSALGSALVSTNGSVASGPRSINVSTDHNQRWVGYQTMNVTVPYFTGYLDIAAADEQGVISNSDVVRCAPDVRADKLDPTDTNVWQDNSGTSDPLLGVAADSVFYVDTGSLAVNGDTVIFSGQLVTNALVTPYASSIVAFIKDFDSGWGYHGETTVPLISLTNGEVFSVSKTIAGDGSHVQYGFEWVGPPARTNSTSSSYVGNLGYVLVTNQLVATTASIVSINPNPAQVKLGANITLTSITTGSGLTYQWSKDGANLTDGGGISGATTGNLTLNNVQGTQEGRYSLVIHDSASNTASNSVPLFVYNPSWLYFDRAYNPFLGYINVWNGANLISSRPASGDAGTAPKASFGFAVAPTTLLRASMNPNTDVIMLQPNTYLYDNATNTMDPNYINPDGTAAAYLEQDWYAQNDSLVGNTLVFAGICTSNSLDAKYTATAWVKVSQDWSVENRFDTNLVAGKPFVLTVPVSSTTGKSYAQFGFAIWGPDNSSTNPITQGAVEVKVYSPLSAARSGGNLNLGFPTVINHSYTLQYKTNLTDSTWKSLSTNIGTGTTVTVPDPATTARRFYRLWIQ